MGVKTFDVLRDHEGDKLYKPGDTREVDAGSVKHLVGLGVLREPGSYAKLLKARKVGDAARSDLAGKGGEASADGLEDKSDRDLRDLAKTEGVDLKGASKPADVIAEIRAARAASASATAG